MALMQQQMAMQGMNQTQFPQGYAIPQQAHVQNLGNSVQLHPSQIPRPAPLGNPMEMQQQMANGQPVPNMAQRAPQSQGQPQFTQQEQHQIMQLAENMAQNCSPEQRNNVQRMVMSIPVDQRQHMLNQGLNPTHAVFRQHAIKKFLHDKAAIQQQRAGQGPHLLDRGGPGSQQGRPPSQISMRPGQQVPPPPATQHHEPPFDQLLGQQQDALRHQEAGQVVVPASQGAPPQVRGTPHPQPPGQFAGRPMQPPGNFQQQQPSAVWNNPQGQHQNQTAQSQIPPQTPNLANMPGQTHQQALQGQLGGLDSSRAQRTPQQNPNMPTLNRPLNPPNQAQNAQRQAQPTPKTGARNATSGQQTTAASGQPSVGQQPAPANPQQQRFQRYVANMPEPQRSAVIAKIREEQERRRGEQAAQATTQAGPSGAPVAPMGGQVTQAQPASKPNQNVPQPQNPMNRLNGQVAAPQQSGAPNGARGPQQKFPPISLDESTTRMMDRVDFPRSLLAPLAGENAKVPEHIKQWGQLKQWVLQNSNILPPGSIQKVMGLQSIVYQQKVAQNNQQKEALNQAQPQGNTRPAQPGVAPAAQMVAPNSSQASIQGSTAQAPNSSMPVLPPPTVHEITAARAQLPPNMKTASDEQIRQMILHKRRQELLKATQGQKNLTPQQQQQMNLLRLQQQATGQQAQGPMQLNQHSQLQPPQRGQNQQPQQWPQPQAAPKMAQPNPQQVKQPQSGRSGPQASGPQPNLKGGKRNINSDDVIEVPDPKLSQQQPRPPNIKGPQHQPPPTNALLQMTPEKYNSIPPEQKAHLQEQRRLHIEASQRASAQRFGQNVQGQRPAEAVNQHVVQNAGRDGRLNELRSEVMESMPTRQPVPMSPNTRARMIERLGNAGKMILRLDHSLPLYLSLSKDEEKTKDLLRSVCSFVKVLETAS